MNINGWDKSTVDLHRRFERLEREKVQLGWPGVENLFERLVDAIYPTDPVTGHRIYNPEGVKDLMHPRNHDHKEGR